MLNYDLTNIMISLISISDAQAQIANQVQSRRVAMGLTQKEFAKRAGVKLPTLRKFEQKGVLSLESFLKMMMVLGELDNIARFLIPKDPVIFSSIDDVLKQIPPITRKRGRRQ